MPDPDERQAVADAISEHPEAELVDFTRDVYRTMYVSASTDSAADEVATVGEDAGYSVTRRGPDGQRLVLEAPQRGLEKGPFGR